MLNQSFAGLEFSSIVAINVIAMKGRIPDVRLMNLYLPVLCIDHLQTQGEREVNPMEKYLYPANMDPITVEMPLGTRCKPE
jgi:hypothetical protein